MMLAVNVGGRVFVTAEQALLKEMISRHEGQVAHKHAQTHGAEFTTDADRPLLRCNYVVTKAAVQLREN